MSSMTLGQAVKNSVEIERAAERFYRRLAKGAVDDEVKAFFSDMAEQERQHAAWIQEIGERLEAGAIPERADAKVTGVERAPGWEDVDGISLDEAVALALEAENNAAMYYDAMSDFTTGEVKTFFQGLARTEEQHAEKLQAFAVKHLG